MKIKSYKKFCYNSLKGINGRDGGHEVLKDYNNLNMSNTRHTMYETLF
jgi:hypothetical protein